MDVGEDGPLGARQARLHEGQGGPVFPLPLFSCSSCPWNHRTNEGADNTNKTAKVSIF